MLFSTRNLGSLKQVVRRQVKKECLLVFEHLLAMRNVDFIMFFYSSWLNHLLTDDAKRTQKIQNGHIPVPISFCTFSISIVLVSLVALTLNWPYQQKQSTKTDIRPKGSSFPVGSLVLERIISSSDY